MNKMEELTEQDLDMSKYFWQEKEDLERFTDFEKLKPLLEKEKPEVLKAWNDYKAYKKILDIVMDNICYD
jgi:hypothetical protein